MADQDVARQIITELTRAKTSATDADREEAKRFESIEQITNELEVASDAYTKHKKEFEQSHAALTEKQANLANKLSSLERSEPEAETRKRKRYVIGGVFAGLIAVIVGLFLMISGYADPDNMILIPVGFFCIPLGIIPFVIAWRNTNRYREFTISSLRKELQDTGKLLESLLSQDSSFATGTVRVLAEIQNALRDLGSTIVGDSAVNDRIFEPYFDAIRKLSLDWMRKHPETKFLGVPLLDTK